MAAKEHKRDILIEKRARALAMMLLTRRKDLLIEEIADDIGLQYVVRFHTEDKAGLREFGIALRGHLQTVTRDEADQLLHPLVQQLKRDGPFLHPICLFLFTMANDGAWYTWVAAPVVEEGEAILRYRDESDCRPLDKKALKEITRLVDSWYDALFPRLVVNGPAGSKGERRQSAK